MSKGTFKPVRRSRATRAHDSDVNCYLSVDGRVTLRELYEYFAANPYVNGWDVELNFATAVWSEPPTHKEVQDWAAWETRQAERHAEWERRIYAELKAKFEPAGEKFAEAVLRALRGVSQHPTGKDPQ